MLDDEFSPSNSSVQNEARIESPMTSIDTSRLIASSHETVIQYTRSHPCIYTKQGSSIIYLQRKQGIGQRRPVAAMLRRMMSRRGRGRRGRAVEPLEALLERRYVALAAVLRARALGHAACEKRAKSCL